MKIPSEMLSTFDRLTKPVSDNLEFSKTFMTAAPVSVANNEN